MACRVLLVFLLGMAAAGCRGTPKATGDAGSGDIDAGVDAGPEPTTRELLAGTYCQTRGDVDASCVTASDCIGYRVPVPVSCCDPAPLRLPDCAFANVATFPAESSVCGADDACRYVARTCVDGGCIVDLPEVKCRTDADCRLVDYGCDCVALPVGQAFDPEYGVDCAGLSACQPDTIASCAGGYCLPTGPFIGAGIAAFCGCVPDLFGITVEDCVSTYSSPGYVGSAGYWPFFHAALTIGDTSGGRGSPVCDLLWDEVQSEARICLGALCAGSACSDRVDNDGDGFTDYPDDLSCVDGLDDDER